MKIARIYLRVSTQEQDLSRQEQIIENAKAAGFYIAGIYKEKASGVSLNRPELLRMISELQTGDVVIAERIDRISRLPLPEAEKLIASIREKGAKLSVPGIVDLSELAVEADGMTKIVLDSVQDMLLKLALQIAHDDYTTRRDRQQQGIALAKKAKKFTGRKPNELVNKNIVDLRKAGTTINDTAQLTKSSVSHVKSVWAKYKAVSD
ncbi:MAG: recombinase family protein [Methyloglobulus sp.]|uniref:recombinase family protein n=1 Tax=Methyloglobulus sp. TaxID=2518622 RepID=UPI00183E29BF|nr:recombinase family protein [Methyloglobulus sp.]